jgi:hypothetical protein
MTAAQVHWLKTGRKTWAPPALYVLDTETRTVTDGDTEIEQLRLWCAAIIGRTNVGVRTHEWGWTQGRTAAGLAASIDRASRLHPTLWLFAHNLAFDLVTTQAPLALIADGWEVGDFALSSDTPWMRMHNGKRSLTLVDSVSWLPASIKDIGRLIGHRKPPLPTQHASERVWLRRCRADVAILARALLAMMDWHEREGGGFWSVTGTATAWGHMRRRLPDQAFLIDPAIESQTRDRAALFGGRRSVWRVGTFRGRRYLEIDLVAAYPTVAGVLPVPTRRVETFDTVPLDHAIWADPRYGLLAECRVRTTVPRYPFRHGDATWYPTGEFDTTLAGPELARARQRGELAWVGAGELHRVAPVLADWSKWILAQRFDRDTDTPDVVRLAAKVWARTVIGRFGSHSWTRTELGPAPGDGWHYEPGVNAATGLPAGTVDLGGRRWLVMQDEGAENAYPAVTAWVESAIRDRLATVIEMIGEGAILTAHTDGLIVAESILGTPAANGAVVAPNKITGAARTRWVLAEVSAAVAPLRLVVKRSATNVSVLGPAHVRFGAQRKLSGIPADADEPAPGVFGFRAWPSLTWQMQAGDRRGYHRPMAVRRVDGPYPAGWVLDDGTVHPPHAVVGKDGVSRLVAWARTPGRPADRELREAQHPVLDALM